MYNKLEIASLSKNIVIVIIVGASFALYNTARIATIITKHNEKVLHGDYPRLPDVKNVDFSQLQEEVSIVFLGIFYRLGYFILSQFCDISRKLHISIILI